MDWALRRPDLGWRWLSESAKQDERAYVGEGALRDETVHDDADFSSPSFAANRPSCQASMAGLTKSTQRQAFQGSPQSELRQFVTIREIRVSIKRVLQPNDQIG
jgi:hypothetical protein